MIDGGDEIVVVGGSIAGFSAAAELRARGFDGRIRIVGDEPVRTYERPPLSKDVLGGADASSAMWQAAADDDLALDWHLGERATALDPAERTVSLASGSSLHYDGLVIACGAAARRLPGTADRAGLHVVRTLDDALGLRADLDAGLDAGPAAGHDAGLDAGTDTSPGRGTTSVVVVGAGFIGAEVAATCRTRGHDVTLVEPQDGPMLGIVGRTISDAIADLHRSHGVDLRTGVGVAAVHGADRVEAVELTDGSSVAADVCVVGIGVVPNTAWLEGSGLPVDDGVVTDRTCRVADRIVACGDVARWDSPRYGPSRIEHWDHAVEMGQAAGARLLVGDDDAVAFDPVPWFWSDQYDVRLQVAGRLDGDMAITAGWVEDGKFAAVFGRDGEVRGALGWNWPARAVRYRMALEDGLTWSEAVGASA